METNAANFETPPVGYQNSLFLKKDSKYKKVELSDITYLEADNSYTTVFTNEDKYIYSVVLKKIEERLPRNTFIRVHRSYIVNINAVDGFERNVLYIKDKRIPVSRQHREEVFELLIVSLLVIRS